MDINTEKKPLVDKPTSSDNVSLTTWRRFLIGPILSIYMLGYMMSYYTITEYTNHQWLVIESDKAGIPINTSSTSNSNCDDRANKSSKSYKASTKAAEMASEYLVYFSIAQGLPAIISNMILGSYTDALGRKFLLAVGISGTAIRLILSSVVIYFKFNMLYIVGACIIEGISGQYATTLQASLAYTSDITDPTRQRVFGVALIMFMLGTSLTLASLAAGFLIESYGYLIPMAVSAIMLVISFILCVLLLPESFPKNKRIASKSLKTVIWNSVSFLSVNDVNNNRWKYRLLFLTHALCDFSFLGRIGTETIYQMSPPFCWSADKVGIFGSARTMGMMVIGLGSIKCLKMMLPDVSIAMLGVTSYLVGFVLTAFAKNDIWLYSAGVANCFGALETTMIRTIASTLTHPSQQGALFSGLASLEMIVNLLSNIGTGAIYSQTVSFMRGFVFLVLSFCNLLAILSLAETDLELSSTNYLPNAVIGTFFVAQSRLWIVVDTSSSYWSVFLVKMVTEACLCPISLAIEFVLQMGDEKYTA